MSGLPRYLAAPAGDGASWLLVDSFAHGPSWWCADLSTIPFLGPDFFASAMVAEAGKRAKPGRPVRLRMGGLHTPTPPPRRQDDAYLNRLRVPLVGAARRDGRDVTGHRRSGSVSRGPLTKRPSGRVVDWAVLFGVSGHPAFGSPFQCRTACRGRAASSSCHGVRESFCDVCGGAAGVVWHDARRGLRPRSPRRQFRVSANGFQPRRTRRRMVTGGRAELRPPRLVTVEMRVGALRDNWQYAAVAVPLPPGAASVNSRR